MLWLFLFLFVLVFLVMWFFLEEADTPWYVWVGLGVLFIVVIGVV